MRACFVLLFAGCVQRQPPDPPPPPPPDLGGWTGPEGDPISGCRDDDDCGGLVCARDGACYEAADVRVIHASWTVDGRPATIATCTSPDLAIAFAGDFGGYLGFAPVPCSAGLFTVDKLPVFFTQVELGIDGEGASTSATFDDTGAAALDL